MGKFYVVNELRIENIVVREGNGSAFSKVTSIPPGEYYMVSVDSRATCREFLLVLEIQEKLQEGFTSDECLEYAEVRITGYDASRLYCTKVPRISRDVSVMFSDANLSNVWQSILRFFRIGGKRPQTGLVSQTNGATQTDRAEDQATVPVSEASS